MISAQYKREQVAAEQGMIFCVRRHDRHGSSLVYASRVKADTLYEIWKRERDTGEVHTLAPYKDDEFLHEAVKTLLDQ